MNIPKSLRLLRLRKPFRLEDVFYACNDATDPEDLLVRLQAVVRDTLTLVAATRRAVLFSYKDASLNVNYLKVIMKREAKENG